MAEQNETKIYRHKKRGTLYALIGIGKMQTAKWLEQFACSRAQGGSFREVDMREVAIYRSLDDGQIWVRPLEEFEDGRFELAVNLRHSPIPHSTAA